MDTIRSTVQNSQHEDACDATPMTTTEPLDLPFPDTCGPQVSIQDHKEDHVLEQEELE